MQRDHIYLAPPFFLRGKLEAAVKEYTSSLRYVPSAIVFSNRAFARLRLDDAKVRCT